MDDQADPKVGITVANKLKVNNDVMGVIGPWNSGVAIPASPIYSEAKLPLFAVASDPKLTRQGFTNIFRVGSTNDFRLSAGKRTWSANGRRSASRSSTTTRSWGDHRRDVPGPCQEGRCRDPHLRGGELGGATGALCSPA